MLGHVSEICLARTKRTDKQWAEEVEHGNGQPGSGAREEHSLLVDQHVDVERTQGGGYDTCTVTSVATGGAVRSSGGDPQD
jgi:hypothetical protein